MNSSLCHEGLGKKKKNAPANVSLPEKHLSAFFGCGSDFSVSCSELRRHFDSRRVEALVLVTASAGRFPAVNSRRPEGGIMWRHAAAPRLAGALSPNDIAVPHSAVRIKKLQGS